MQTERQGIRFSASMLVAGIIITAVAGVLHPAHEPPNDHIAAFTEYANTPSWTAVHLGQFVGMAVVITALVLLSHAMRIRDGLGLWLGRLALVAAGASLALYAVLQAVDGVALKHSVDAWVAAPEAEKVSRFAVAEGVRWMEWAVRSYFSFVFACFLVFFGAALSVGRQLPLAVGTLLILAGLSYLAQGWVLGTEGFSDANSLPTLAGIVCIVIAAVWMLVATLRQPPDMRPG